MKSGDPGSEEVRIVVERGGFGPHKWRWRLARECGLSVGVGTGFKSAEDAYQAARERVLDLRSANDAPGTAGFARR
ncbi:hypothetical protein [Muricoccus vinaceus]|uniref:DUF1508 domain-containing protein n=1 Tax=Muricoccus vinaceus TaxID=424704 RepID=A0ABV6IN91_9PROT